MYISEVEIKNYRIYLDTKIQFNDGLNVIVGPNNIGKTNLLNILNSLSKKPESNIDDFNKYNLIENYKAFIDNPPEISIIYTINHVFSYDEEDSAFSKLRPIIVYDKNNSLEEDGNKKIHIEAKVVLKYFLDIIYINEYKNKMKDVGDVDTFLNQLKLFKNQFEWKYFNYINGEEIKKEDINSIFEINFIEADRDTSKLTDKSQLYIDSYIKKLNETKEAEIQQEITDLMKKELEEVIKDVDNDIESDQKEIGITEGKNKFVSTFLFDDPLYKYFKYELKNDNGNFMLPLKNNGLGYNNLIYIRNLIKQSKDEDYNILLLEEPEAHLHPNMQYKLLKYLNSLQTISKGKETINNQIIVSTHSANISATVDMEKIIILSLSFDEKSNKYNVIANRLSNSFDFDIVRDLIPWDSIYNNGLEKEQENFSKLLINSKKHLIKFLDITRCDMLYSDKIILVEGIAEKLYIPYKFGDLVDKHVSIVEVGGINFNSFLPLVFFTNKKILCITDRDFNIYDEKEKRLEDDYRINYFAENNRINKAFVTLSNIKIEKQLELGSTFEKELFITNYKDKEAFTLLLSLALPECCCELINNKSLKYWSETLENSGINNNTKKKIQDIIDKYKDTYDNSNDEDKDIVEMMFFTNLFYSYVKDKKGEFMLNLIISDNNNIVRIPKYIEEGVEWLLKN